MASEQLDLKCGRCLSYACKQSSWFTACRLTASGIHLLSWTVWSIFMEAGSSKLWLAQLPMDNPSKLNTLGAPYSYPSVQWSVLAKIAVHAVCPV